ncbi:MAG: hypothetical protein K6C34_00915 [Alphaproteobacteria bacterium]|nr:hypothetical protein [Alphaproteobacteria bacterium]
MAEQFGVMELVKDILSTINDAMRRIKKRVLQQVKEEETNTDERGGRMKYPNLFKWLLYFVGGVFVAYVFRDFDPLWHYYFGIIIGSLGYILTEKI